MKKTILTLLLFVIAMAMTRAQSVNFTIAPVVCYNGPGNTFANAIITQTAGASSYSWNVVSASSSSCNANYSSNPWQPVLFLNISFNCCGLYTVTCIPSSGASVSHTLNVVCPSPIVIAPTPSVICPGDSVTLAASGAGSYTWSTGQVGNSIHVSPT